MSNTVSNSDTYSYLFNKYFDNYSVLFNYQFSLSDRLYVINKCSEEMRNLQYHAGFREFQYKNLQEISLVVMTIFSSDLVNKNFEYGRKYHCSINLNKFMSEFFKNKYELNEYDFIEQVRKELAIFSLKE